jgi:putative protease
MEHLGRAATRPLNSGFFCPKRRVFFTPPSDPPKTVLGRIVRQLGDDSWEIAVKNPWESRDWVAVVAPGLKRPVLGPHQFGLETTSGEAVKVAHPGLNYVLRAQHPSLASHLFLETCPDPSKGK